MENAEKRPIYDIYNCSKFHFSDFFPIKQYFALKGQVKEEPNDFNIQSNYILACQVTNWFGYIYTMNMFFIG